MPKTMTINIKKFGKRIDYKNEKKRPIYNLTYDGISCHTINH